MPPPMPLTATATAAAAAAAGRVAAVSAAFGAPPAAAAAVREWRRDCAASRRPDRGYRRATSRAPANGSGRRRRLLSMGTGAASGGDSGGNVGGGGGAAHPPPPPPTDRAAPPSPSGMNVRVPSAEVLATVTRVLTRRGTPPADAVLMAEVLHYAEASGNSQGLATLVSSGVGGLRGDGGGGAAQPPPLVAVATSPISARIDATGRSGMVAMAAAADEAIRLATLTGTVGVVGTTGTTSGSGAIGYYARRVAAAGLFGLAASGSSPLVAPSGARVPLLGTNPLAYGIPVPAPVDGGGDDGGGGGGGGGEPPAGTLRPPPPPCDVIVADIGTSALSYWAVRAAAAAGTALPAHVALDAAGTPTVTAAAAAALLPFGGPAAAHKASALGVLVEWLTGPAVGAPAAGVPHAATAAGRGGHPPRGWGNVVVAVSPSLLRPAAEVAADTAAMVAALCAGGTRLPGVGGDARRAAAAADGVRVDGRVWRRLVDEAAGGQGGRGGDEA